MVNQTLVNYLKEYSAKYPLDSLKQKIISSGYSEKDFDEAVSSLNLSPAPENKKIKWMKIAGISGIIPALIIAVFLILSLIGTNNLIYQLALLAVLILSYFLFIFGFVVLGRKTQSKLLIFSSWSQIVMLALIIIGAIASFFMLKTFLLGIFSGAPLTDMSSLMAQLSSKIIIFAIVLGIFALFAIINQILFYSGLIIAGRQIKFAKLAGIFGLILLVSSAVPFLFKNLEVLSLLPSILSLLGFIFQILALFDASKKFE